MMKRFVSMAMAFLMAWSGGLLQLAEAYAASQPVIIEETEDYTIWQNADGTQTIRWLCTVEIPADPTQPEEWVEQGDSWSNEGAVARTTLRKNYVKNETLVTMSKDGASVSFAPIQIEEDLEQPQTEVAPSQQLSENQTVSNVLRIGAAGRRRPTRIEGRIRRGGLQSREAAPAVYEGLFDEHTDVHLTALSGGIKEDIVVNAYTGNHVYAFRMTLEGLSAQQKGQIIYLANGEGTIVAQIDAPYMFDASGAYSEDIAVSLVQEGGVYRLTYVPSDAWMKNAVYPVTIDPSGNYLNDLATGIGDVYVSSGQPNHRYDHMVPSGSAQLDYSLEGNNLMVGNRSGSNYYAYIWPTLRGTFDANSSPFPNASNILIRSASWNFQMHDGTSSNQRFNAHLITRSWDVTNLTYNNRPTETSKVYASGTIGSGWNRFDMTELFGAWFDTLGGQMQNFGFVLKAAEGRANDYRRLYSADIRPRTMRMYFEATYYTDPARPNVTITAGDYGVNSESGFVNLSWNAVTGADGYVLGIHNGQAYDYRYIGNVTSYTTQGKGLWPTTAQMAAGQNGIRWDGTGRELPNVPRVTSTDLNYYFRVIPTNRFGQASSSASAADRSIVLPDTTPPNQPATVTVNPATWSNAATMAVTWSGVTDLPVNTGNLGTGRIQYVIDPSPLLTDPKDWPWVNTTSNLPNGSFTFSTDGLLDGTHTIYVRGMDARGNYGAPGGAEFKVDKTPPTAPIVSVDPAPPVWTNANTASLTWSGIEDLDANLPLARVECRFGTGTWINTGQTGQSYSGYPLDISQLDGPQTVSVRGVDRAGNDGLPGTATVNVDRSPPIFDTAGITPSFWTALNEVEFAWQGATDTYSGLDTLAYAINNENEVALAATEDGTATINIAHLADGQHTLHFLLTDKVGNEHGEEITIYVDRTDPVIALLAPDDGEWISGITEVWGSISDLSIKTWTLTVTGEDGVDRQISSGTDNRVPQILGRLNAGLFADGEQVRLTLYAEDHAGNHSTVTGVYLVVDKSVKPIVSNIEITTPTSGQALTTAKAEGSYDIQYAEPESETFIYVDGKYVHDARAGQLFDLYPILYQENALHTVTAVSLDTVGGVHFSQGLGAYSLLSDAFADNSLLADYTGVSFSDSGDGALGAGSLTSITATSPKPLVAFRLHAAEQGSISYEYQTEGGTWTSVDPGKYVVFKTPVYSLQTRAVLASGAVLHGWEIEGVVELNPVRFISQLEKKAEALRIVESQVNRALPVLTTTPAPQLVAQVQFVNGEQEKDDFVLDALRTQEGGRLPVALLGEDAQGTLYAAESPASATLLREVLPAPQSEEIRTLTSTGDLYALRLVPWSDGAAPAYTYSVDNGATWAALLPDAYTVLSKASKEVQIKATMPVGSVLKAWHIEGVTATPKNITVRILQAPQNVIAADYGAYPPAQQKTVISWTDPNTADPTLGNANVTVVLKNGIYLGETTDTRFTDAAYNATARYSVYFVRVYGQPGGLGPHFLRRESAITEAQVTRMRAPEQILGASDMQLLEFEQSEYLNELYGGNYTFSTEPHPPSHEFALDQSLLGPHSFCSHGFEPINFNTGNFYLMTQDVHLPDLGGTVLEVLRTYNTQSSETDGPFGSKWASELGQHLMLYPDGSLAYRKTHGAQVIFYKNADGTYTYDDADRFTLTMDEEAGEYRIEEAEGTAYVFTLFGLLKRIEQPSGQEISVERNGLGLITGIVAPSGARLDIEMDEAGHITQITMPGGETIRYTYKGKNLVSVTDARGNVTRYVYDDQGRMTEWFDANGKRQVYNVYDEQDRVVYQEDVFDGKYHLEYFEDHTVTTDAVGNVEAHYFDQVMHTTKIVDAMGGETSFAYDENGQIVAMTDQLGGVTAYEFNANGDKIKEVAPNGAVTAWTYDDNHNQLSMTESNGAITQYEYDQNRNLLREIAPDGGVTAYAYDSNGNMVERIDPLGGVTRYEYENGLLIKEIDALDNETVYAYDAHGNMIAQVDALGVVTTYTYDAQGNQLTETLADGAQIRYTYDALRRMTSMTDRMGNVTKYQYDGLGHLIATILPDGTKETKTYTLNYQLATEQNALQETVAYTYDGNLNRLTETDAMGYVTATEYDLTGRIIKEISPTGGETVYTYDEGDLPIAITDATGATYSLVYDLMGNILSYTLPNGAVFAAEYDEMSRPVKQVNPLGGETIIEYDLLGRVVSETDPLGAKTTYTYDALGNLLSMTDALGAVTAYQYDALGRMVQITDPLGATITYAYDIVGNLIASTDALGNTTTYQYDANANLIGMTDALGHTMSYAYDKNGRSTAVIQRNGGVLATAYDKAGRAIAETDELGRTTRFKYNKNGLMTELTDALGQKAIYEYNPLGHITRIAVAGRDITTYEFDAAGRPLSMVDAVGLVTELGHNAFSQIETMTANGATTIFEYDLASNIIAMTDAEGRRLEFVYDTLDNLLETIYPDGSKDVLEYDVLGRVVKSIPRTGLVTEYSYDLVGNVVSEAQGKQVMKYEYDLLGQLVKTIHPDNTTNTFEYDALGNMISETDALGNITHYSYTAESLLDTVTYANQTTNSYGYDLAGNIISETNGEGHTKHFRYDKVNRLTTVVDEMRNTTRYGYDAWDNIVRATNALQYVTRYTYDENGNLTSETDALGNTIAYAYTPEGWLESITKPDGVILRFVYDKTGNLVAQDLGDGQHIASDYNEIGKVTKVSSPEGDIVYQYDEFGHLISVENPHGDRVTYTHDAHGNKASMTYPDGRSVSYEYDAMNRMVSVVDLDGEKTTYAYDAAGRKAQTSSNDLTTTYEYDSVHNLLMQISSGATDISFVYAYDSNRYITQETRVEGGVSTNSQYAYDPLGQLTGFASSTGFSETYAYDRVGNMRRRVITPVAAKPVTLNMSYNRSNQLTSMRRGNDRLAYAYDKNGNMTQKSLTSRAYGMLTDTYAYNSMDMLTGYVGYDGFEQAFAYDANGMRLSKKERGNAERSTLEELLRGNITGLPEVIAPRTVESNVLEGYEWATTEYLYDITQEFYQVIQTRTSNGRESNMTAYTYGLERLAAHKQNEKMNYVYDGRTSVAQVVGAAQVISFAYTPFGEQFGAKATGFGYNAEWLDAATGMINLRARQYEPQSMRFSQYDALRGTAENPRSQNRYVYCLNDPLNLVDRDGNAPTTKTTTTVTLRKEDRRSSASLGTIKAGSTVTIVKDDGGEWIRISGRVRERSGVHTGFIKREYTYLNTTSYIISQGAVFKNGSEGDEVWAIQRRLYALGYLTVNPTGYYGSATIRAVRLFQAAHGLKVDSQVGSLTWEKLFGSSAAYATSLSKNYEAPVLKRGDRGSDVRQLQLDLQKVGFPPGPIDADFGRQTQAAVRAFQRARGLIPDGVVGFRTRDALDKALAGSRPSPQTPALQR